MCVLYVCSPVSVNTVGFYCCTFTFLFVSVFLSFPVFVLYSSYYHYNFSWGSNSLSDLPPSLSPEQLFAALCRSGRNIWKHRRDSMCLMCETYCPFNDRLQHRKKKSPKQQRKLLRETVHSSENGACRHREMIKCKNLHPRHQKAVSSKVWEPFGVI